MYADFHFYYGLDVPEMLESGVPPARFFALIARLPEGSMTRALQEGGDEDWRLYLDMSHDSYALAGIYNAVNTNTAATGWFKKPPKFDPWPTPQVVLDKRSTQIRTVEDLWRSLGGATAED